MRNLVGRVSAPGLRWALNQFARRATLLQAGRDITRLAVPGVAGTSGRVGTSRQNRAVPQ
jgi:hypothetical protein